MICTLPGHTGGAMLDWLCGRRTSMQGIPWQFVTHPMIFRANTDLFWSLQSHNFLPIFHDLFHLIHILLSGLLIINSNWFIPIYKKGVLKIVKPRFRHLFRHKKPSGIQKNTLHTKPPSLCYPKVIQLLIFSLELYLPLYFHVSWNP